MKALIVIAMLMLSGCATASMVNFPGASGVANAPSNEGRRPGSIRYLNQGASFIINSRREDAYKQMSDACGGRYQIVSEGPQSGGTSIMPMGTGFYAATSEYWYITFQCD